MCYEQVLKSKVFHKNTQGKKSRPVTSVNDWLVSVRSVHKLLDSPWLVSVARRGIGVLEIFAFQNMTSTAIVVLVCILLRVVAHNPVCSSFAEDIRIPGNLVPVCVVELFSVVKAHFLGTRHALKPA